MKKMNVLLLLVVLMLSMTHTASALVPTTEFADGCYCVNLVGDYSVAQLDPTAAAPALSVIPSATFHLDVNAKVCKSGDEITVEEFNDVASDLGVVLDTCIVTGINEDTIELYANGTCMDGNYFEGQMTLVKSNDGSYVTQLITPATGTVNMTNPPLGLIPVMGEFTATITPCEQQIPEFPTVALPMIAIIGLAFFIQRRKE